MQRTAFFVYGVACHVLFLATYAYMCGFVGNFLAPKSIDSPAAVSVQSVLVPGALAAAVLINVALLAVFGLQHSIMARPAFKRIWTRLVPEPIERATYVLFSCGVLALTMWLWQGIDLPVWEVTNPVGRTALWCLFAIGWLGVPAVSLMIHHFDLFGTRQVWLHLRRQAYTPLKFRTPLAYAHVRHPLYVGWAVAFWATPAMTLGHFLFAAVLTAYMLIAVIFEERDLVKHFGAVYEDYRRRVPAFVPRFGLNGRRPQESTATSALREVSSVGHGA